MHKTVQVSVADLLLDQKNARFADEQPNQQAAMLTLARLEGRELLKQAEDIVEFGLDPLALTGLVEADSEPGRYVVIEGNRRILALKALENPALVTPALGPAGRRHLERLSQRFGAHPLRVITAMLFDSEEELAHWVTLRHTGANEGVGLVSWGAREKDRWNRRHGHGREKPEGIILDFVEKAGGLSDAARESKRKVFTNLGRIE